MPGRGDENVVRLDVAVDDPKLVQVLNGEHGFLHDRHRLIPRKGAFSLKEGVDIAPRGVLHDEEDVRLGTKRKEELRHKIVLLTQEAHNPPLVQNPLRHSLSLDLLLGHYFHRVHVLGRDLFHKEDGAKRTLAQYVHDFKVPDSVGMGGGVRVKEKREKERDRESLVKRKEKREKEKRQRVWSREIV